MSLEKFKLFYNSSVGVDDEIKSFLHFSDGTALTHTAGALNVNITSPLSIDVDLDHANDSVKIGDGTDFLAINADGSLNAVISDGGGSITVDGTVDIGNTVTVQATDLDIRNLAFATDTVDVSGSAVSITGTVTVSSTNLDIRDLTAATDSVSAWTKDGSGNAIGSLAGNLRVADCVMFGSVSAPTLTTANTAATVTAIADQQKVEVQNLSNQDLYYGPVGTTTVANGLLIPKSSIKELPLCGSFDLIAANSITAGQVRVGHFIAG